jgi:hypothetical protein
MAFNFRGTGCDQPFLLAAGKDHHRRALPDAVRQALGDDPVAEDPLVLLVGKLVAVQVDLRHPTDRTADAAQRCIRRESG